MNEIEVGDYVRLKDGTVGKYNVNKNWINVVETNDRYIGFDIETDIVKHSKNKIDLVEVGDIVHIKDVLHEDIVYIWTEEYLKQIKEDINSGLKLFSIVTHEQFKSVEYIF